MSGFITWLGGAVAASFLLTLVVLAVRRPVTRLFGPGVAYALWLLPALRMVLPPLPPGWVFGDTAMVFDPPRMVAVTNMPTAAPAAAAPVEWLLPLLGLWAAGALVHFAWQLFAHHRFLRRSLAGSALVTRAAGIEVRRCPAVDGPMATGVLRRFILLPADFTQRFAPEERRLALAHETAHHCRGDLVANFAGLALLSLHWFNPVAHLAYRAFRDDQEAACDATVLNAESRERRHAYGSAILKSASCRVPGAACALGHAGAMKRRILIMIDGRKSRALRVSGAALAVALVGSGLVATATIAAPPPPRMTHHVIIEGEGDALTITEDGVTRRPTPAERRDIERDVARAHDDARAADREAHRFAVAEAPRPLAPPRVPAVPATPDVSATPDVPPVPEVAPVAPPPPLPPVPPQGHRRITYLQDGDWAVDKAAIRAEVDAATADAQRAVADARAQVAAMHIDTGRITAEVRAAQAQAQRDTAQALRDAAAARRDARRAVRRDLERG